MNTVTREQLIGQLNWRYATKQFDPNKKISAADWATLEEALTLSPSSFGLQPWKFIIVDDPKTREKLLAASWGQKQIVDASQLVVFAIRNNLGQKDVDAHVARTAEVRGIPEESLAGMRDMIGNFVKGLDETSRRNWAARQVYIALGNFMTSAALLGIDACPMEGVAPAQYDEILGLREKGLGTVVVATAGYRASTDKYATLKKVRFSKDYIIEHI